MNLKNIFKKTINSGIDASQKISNANFIKSIGLKRWLTIFVVLLAIGGIVTSIYYFKQYSALKANPNLEAQREIKSLVNALGRLMELPADETPTVATVLDIEKLKDQPFFAKAQNGDKLLAYTKTMRAILYRPSANKIINVAPLVIDQKKQGGVGDTKPVSQSLTNPQIAYYNGTETAGMSSQAEKLIKNKYPNSKTTILTNAVKKDYQENLIIDLSGKFSDEAREIASLLGGKVVSMPEGEAVPSADILIISGKK